MPPTAEQIEHAIAALEAQRAVLGDGVADIALAPLRAQLAQLAAAREASPVRQLQQVSVLFLDVVGSTALASTLDPEQIQTVMDGLLAALSAVVERHGGRVLQYAGDSLLAAFGADEVHEDDAERAVLGGPRPARRRAAPRPRGSGRRRSTCAWASAAAACSRAAAVDGDNSIRGLTVNIAARMEQTAPARHAAHQPGHLAPGARPVRGRRAAAAAGEGPRRAGADLARPRRGRRGPGRRAARRGRRARADARPRRRTGAAAGCIRRIAQRRQRAGHGAGGGRRGPGQDAVAR